MKFHHHNDGNLTVHIVDRDDVDIMQMMVRDVRYALDPISSLLTQKIPSELRRDWQNYVTAELDRQFETQVDDATRLIDDLGIGSTLEIDRDNVEFWYSFLNQVRLSLEIRYGIHQKQHDIFYDLTSYDEYLLVRATFYQKFQEHLLWILLRE